MISKGNGRIGLRGAVRILYLPDSPIGNSTAKDCSLEEYHITIALLSLVIG